MANKTCLVSIMVIAAAILILNPIVALKGASSPAAVDCSSVTFDMVPCLDYITEPSNQTIPTEECCGGVTSVAALSPICLCSGLQLAVHSGVAINVRRAGKLPRHCKLDLPPVSKCHIKPMSTAIPPSSVKTPASSPAPEVSSPSLWAAATAETPPPSTSPSPSSSPSSEVPTSSPSNSSSSTLVSSGAMFALSLIVAACF